MNSRISDPNQESWTVPKKITVVIDFDKYISNNGNRLRTTSTYLNFGFFNAITLATNKLNVHYLIFSRNNSAKTEIAKFCEMLDIKDVKDKISIYAADSKQDDIGILQSAFKSLDLDLAASYQTTDGNLYIQFSGKYQLKGISPRNNKFEYFDLESTEPSAACHFKKRVGEVFSALSIPSEVIETSFIPFQPKYTSFSKGNILLCRTTFSNLNYSFNFILSEKFQDNNLQLFFYNSLLSNDNLFKDYYSKNFLLLSGVSKANTGMFSVLSTEILTQIFCNISLSHISFKSENLDRSL